MIVTAFQFSIVDRFEDTYQFQIWELNSSVSLDNFVNTCYFFITIEVHTEIGPVHLKT